MRCDVPAFATRCRLPIPFANSTSSQAVNSNGTIVLLSSVDSVGKMVVGRHSVELSGRLIHATGPVRTSAETDLAAAIVRDDQMVRVIGVDPKVVVINVGRSNPAKRLASVLASPEPNVQAVDFVNVVRASIDSRVVPSSLAEVATFVDFAKALAAIVAAKQSAFVRFDYCPDPFGIDRRNGNANDANFALG